MVWGREWVGGESGGGWGWRQGERTSALQVCNFIEYDWCTAYNTDRRAKFVCVYVYVCVCVGGGGREFYV